MTEENATLINLCNRTKVKQAAKQLGTEMGINNISRNFYDKLDEKIYSLIIQALVRTVQNKRRTLKGCDI